MTAVETQAQALAGKIDAADLTPLTSLLETGLAEIGAGAGRGRATGSPT